VTWTHSWDTISVWDTWLKRPVYLWYESCSYCLPAGIVWHAIN
jgi:hypothetical protein